MALGYAQSADILDAGAHARLMVGATDAAFGWMIWRAAHLNTHVLRGAAAGGGAAAAGPGAGAAAALRALAWGASGEGLAGLVDAEVCAWSEPGRNQPSLDGCTPTRPL